MIYFVETIDESFKSQILAPADRACLSIRIWSGPPRRKSKSFRVVVLLYQSVGDTRAAMITIVNLVWGHSNLIVFVLVVSTMTISASRVVN